MVSFLPLSHVAAQFSDLVTPLDEGNHVYYADPSALQGSLVNTLK
jgi:long-chain-fatty-acid--CoA ligase ACSBG